MNSYRSRLIFPIAIVTLIVIASLGAIIGPVFKEFYLERMYDRVEKEAKAVAFFIEEDVLTETETLTLKLNQLSDRLDIRITLIQLDGTVLVETHSDPLAMENHLYRPEIQQLIADGKGQEIRYSTTLDAELLYHAVPLVQEGQTTAYLRVGLPIEQLNTVYHNIWIIIFISFFIAFLIIVMLATKLTNQLITPIEDARNVANQLAKGNFSARTYEGVNLEVGELNRSINLLAENLEQITKTYEVQQDRLETLIENMGSGLLLINTKGDITLVNRSCKDIFQEDTDQWLNNLYYHVIKHKEIIKFIQEILLTEKRQRRQLSIPMAIEMRHVDVYGAPILGSDDNLNGVVLVFHDITELKKLEQARKDFVANVSHELKTPVTSLKGFTETLLAGAMEDRALREKFITIIANESERLESLIYDLLELSKIEGSKSLLTMQEIDLAQLIDEVLPIFSEKTDAKGIKLKKKITGESTISADPHRLKQIVINLINNAIMYTPENGEVTVRVREQTETVVLEVQDTGIGISKKEIPRIFERFYRVDRARSRNSGGTGLGLAIVKHLVEAHKAKMSVESDVGKGTTFRIAFFKNLVEEDKGN